MQRRRRSLAGGIAALAITMGYGETRAAPITFNTALPVAQGEFVNREQLVVTRSGADPSGAARNLEINTLVSVLGYGVTGKLALFGVLPYADKALSRTSSGARLRQTNSGFGDLTIFGRYTLHQQDAPGRTFRVAGVAGFKAPTGEDDESDSRGRLPMPLQLSTGAWDGFGGIVVTWQTLAYQLDGQMAYRANGSANDFESGDEARLDASLQYRLWPRTLTGGTPGFFYGVLETNLFYRDKNAVRDQRDASSGGTTLFLTPGLQYVSKRWILEATLQLPVVQDLNGTALEHDSVARGGFRWNF